MTHRITVVRCPMDELGIGLLGMFMDLGQMARGERPAEYFVARYESDGDPPPPVSPENAHLVEGLPWALEKREIRAEDALASLGFELQVYGIEPPEPETGEGSDR